MSAQVFDAATLALSDLRLIEASAGTGKTFSLAGLYLRLIVERQVSVRDILVMTFTRAATQELRERIRARLAYAARIAHDPSLADPANVEHGFTQTVLAAADESPTTVARRLADAAGRIDEATIVTIHGFAQRAATENAFESALAFDRGEAVDDPTIYREATHDYWREQVFGNGDDGETVLNIWASPEALYATLAPVFFRSHATIAGIDHERIAERLESLARHWPDTPPTLAATLTTAVEADALLKGHALHAALAGETDIQACVAALDAQITAALAAGRLPALPSWVAALASPRAAFKKAAKHQALADPLDGLEALPILAELQPLARLVMSEKAATRISARAAARKIERRQYSYDDLIVALHDSLMDPRTGPNLADALHARWPYALVDEFQDTDPLQYASLYEIYLARPRETGALLLIGDPKQAIYGFRGGDIYAYLAAARTAGAARYTLTTNFRSTQGVLDSIAALYSLPGAAPFVVEAIDFPNVAAGRTAGDRQLITGDDTPLPAMTVWELTGGVHTQKNGKTRNPNKQIDRDRLIGETVGRIANLLAGNDTTWQHADGTTRAVAARDIAVLVNSHSQAEAMQAALGAAGVRAVCQQRQSVYASAEADDLKRVLAAMAHPDDPLAVRAAQPTGLIGKRLADLIEMADNDTALQAAIERFHDLFLAWQRRGVLSALETLFIAAAPEILALTDGERRMSNYLQLAELLAEAETTCYGMDSLVHWLAAQITAAEAGTLGTDDESQLRLETDADLVRISTIHAAKGLQYPIVFLPFALWLGQSHGDRRPDVPPFVFHPAVEGARPALIDMIGNPDNAAQARLEARSETLRLLYVALTRAEQAVFIGWREPDDSKGVDGALADLLYRSATVDGQALARLTRAADGAVVHETLDIDTPPTIAPLDSPAQAMPQGHARHDLPARRLRWSTYSFSRLAHARTDTTPDNLPEPGAADETPTAPDTLQIADADSQAVLPELDTRLGGVRFGSAVHDLLEDALNREKRDGAEPGSTWHLPGASPRENEIEAVYQKLRTGGLIPEDRGDIRIIQTADLVARTLHTPLPSIGALAGLARANMRTEMEFMLRLRGQRLGTLIDTLRAHDYLGAALGGHPAQTLYGLMQGFIDLVVEHDGRFYILDYKTNRLGDTPTDYDGPALQRAITRSHYDLQYLIYTVALHRHLGHCLPEYDPATHLGGVQYLFLRAMDGQSTAGVYVDTPDIALINALDGLFDETAEMA
ncbi:exodeoxyribonuclease V subunit beta [Salinisphaera japonica]|uniref:RecBCD enzyme subunit RecB n=1 Tax=Salinisphaera japonica YTM-1 TaxID=1209778 RepID=A0A423Q2V4_9GAMM|nr:exodeoxyribonuclease V subunit beta [Salinisphaera japonica]ROO32848.1 exodeoxyribonuclease V subunit beta [Salinisphaera japonica YTM-1]